MMHLTRLLLILLLSSGLWSSLAAKTALPEVEVAYEAIFQSPQTTQTAIAEPNSTLRDCTNYAIGYADGVCDAIGGCVGYQWSMIYVSIKYRCERGNIQ